MSKFINVHGRIEQVVNALSSAPDGKPHTYELYNNGKGGRYVENIAGTWKLYTPGCAPRIVNVYLEQE